MTTVGVKGLEFKMSADLYFVHFSRQTSYRIKWQIVRRCWVFCRQTEQSQISGL